MMKKSNMQAGKKQISNHNTCYEFFKESFMAFQCHDFLNSIATIGLIVVLMNFSGCKPVSDEKAKKLTRNDQIAVTVDSVNYSHERAMQYTLYDLSQTPPQAVGGALVHMLGTGGEKGCCLSLPNQWRPGIKVRVTWDEEDWNQIYPEKYSRDLEIPHYDQPAGLYVVFYPNHELEIITSFFEPGHPEWAGKIKNTPWEECLVHNARKVCKAALPVYGGLSWNEMQGYCTYLKEEKKDMKYCEQTIAECIKNYEDEDRCKRTLWGEQKK